MEEVIGLRSEERDSSIHPDAPWRRTGWQCSDVRRCIASAAERVRPFGREWLPGADCGAALLKTQIRGRGLNGRRIHKHGIDNAIVRGPARCKKLFALLEKR
jgi:hypothetical protein